MMRFFALLTVTAMMAGCSTVQDPFLTASIVSPVAPTVASEVSPDFAIALLPGLSGAVRAVRQQVQDHQVSQEIVYDNPTASTGENMLAIDVGETGGQHSAMKAPSQAEVQGELRRQFPGLAMSISPVIGENVHGVYGFATGAFEATGSCLYAWQVIRNISGGDGAFGSFSGNRYGATVRLRFCSATIGADRISALMQGLRIKPVSDETFAMLRFAAGSAGSSRVDPAPAVQPVAQAAEPDAGIVVKKKHKTSAALPAAVKNAVSVPLPGAASAAAPAATEAVTTPAAKVPLPDLASS